MGNKIKKQLFRHAILSGSLLCFLWLPQNVQAAPVLVQGTDTGVTNGGTSVAATYTSTPTAGNLLIAIAGNRDASTAPTVPAGWSVAISETNYTPGQVIYYTLSDGTESTVTVSGYGTDTRLGLHIYEYSGVNLLGQTSSDSGNGLTISTGAVLTTLPDELVLAALVTNVETTLSGWASSFIEQNDFQNGGAPASKSTYAAAERIASTPGGYTTVTTAADVGAWRSHIVSFKNVPSSCPVVNTTVDGGEGSLRECIKKANLNPGSTISFNIGGCTGASPCIISPTHALPTITGVNTVIDGYTETNAVANTQNFPNTTDAVLVIELNGSSAGTVHGLTVGANNVTIKGLSIYGFSGALMAGIKIDPAGTNASIVGNYLGLKADGSDATTGNTYGLFEESSGCLIGTNAAADRNVISGNTADGVYLNGTGSTMKNNFIGTDDTGMLDKGNTGAGIRIVNGTHIVGGTGTNDGNLISGNGSGGVGLSGATATSNAFYGNSIGLKADGAALGNDLNGIAISAGVASTIIGGAAANQGNIIANNTQRGIFNRGAGNEKFIGNTIRDNGTVGIEADSPGALIERNSIINNGVGAVGGIDLFSNSDGTLVYHNTIHGNAGNGIYIDDFSPAPGAIIKNNNITGNGGYGIYELWGFAFTQEYNNVPASPTTNGNASGSCFNCTLSSTSISLDPDYTGGGLYTLNAGSPAINRGCNLDDAGCQDAGDGPQTDLVNGTGSPVSTKFYGFAPDIGAFESTVTNTCPVSTTADASPTAPYGSLRDCIDYANSNPGTTISFNIPNTDPGYQTAGADNWWRISPGTALPSITANGTVIDGTTQTTNQGDTNSLGPEIEIDGAGNAFGGLALNSNNNTINALIINGFPDSFGVQMTGNANTVTNSYLGTDYSGTNADANGYGIFIPGGTGSHSIGTAGNGNVVSGNSFYGILIAGGVGTDVKGNFFGTNALGTSPVPNNFAGIFVQTNSNIIGGSGAGEGNVVSGNTGDGIGFLGASSNTVLGNFIGTDTAGALDLGNGGDGIETGGTSSSNVIGGTGAGQGNVIAFNGGDGVHVIDANSDDNLITGNSIYENTLLGIKLETGANNDKAAPTISSISPSGLDFTVVATVVSGDTIEFFRVNNTAAPAVAPDGSGSGEGFLFLGSCVDNGACSGPHISAVADANAAGGTVEATLLSSGLVSGDTVSATASDAVNGSSEFSANLSLVSCPVVTTTADSGNGSLRACITYANSNPGTTISFNIPNTDPGYQTAGGDNWWRISPGSILPAITANGTIIDGSTQTTNQGDTNSLGPEIEINGASAGTVDGLRLSSANNTIKDLIVNGFSAGGKAGILITGASATNNTITNNYVGTDYAAASPLPNYYGVYLASDASGNPISNNVIKTNGNYGVYINNSDNNTISTNTIDNNSATGLEIAGATNGSSGNVITGNTISNSAWDGIRMGNAGSTGNRIELNIFNSNGQRNIQITSGGNNTLIYHNTVHNSLAGDGIQIVTGITGTIIKNNIITNSNGGDGIEDADLGASTVIDYNDFFGNSNGPCNYDCTTATNNITSDPQYINAAAGNFALTEPTSPAINTGCDLGAAGDDTACDTASDGAQPDVNGATAGNYNGSAPDMGAFESSVGGTALKLVKKAFLSSDGSAIADTATLPKGTLVKYLIYLNNIGPVINDVSVRDVLDPAFLYQGVAATGTSSLKVNNATTACALADCTAGEETTIFNDVNATAVKTEGVDGDEVSIAGATIDAGDQFVGNGTVNVAANSVWALLFEVKMQ